MCPAVYFSFFGNAEMLLYKIAKDFFEGFSCFGAAQKISNDFNNRRPSSKLQGLIAKFWQIAAANV